MGIIVRLSNPEVREILFKRVLVNLGIQGNHTPMSIVDRMLDKAGELKDKTIMVMFNLEILEGLYRRGLTNQVTFIADSAEEEKFAKIFYKTRTFKYEIEAWANLDNTMEDIMSKMNQAPDITFTNPPYNGNIDLKILLSLYKNKLIKKLVCVHPSTWLIDNKGLNSLYKDFRETFDIHTSDLDIFNGNPIFDINLFVPCVILVMNASASYKTKRINWFDTDKWETASFNDITIHGSIWDPLVKDFQNTVKAYISIHKNLLDNDQKDITERKGKYYVQLASVIGHSSHNKNIMIKEDFYTMVMDSPEDNKGIRKKSSNSDTEKRLPPIFELESEIEQNNFILYLQTDFARLCLSLRKTAAAIARGELSLVPWMDFTRSWTDDELFSELGYHKGHAIREYAKKFLPDYHNIYPNGKTY